MINRKSTITIGLAFLFVFVMIFIFLKSEKENTSIGKNKIATILQKKEKSKAIVTKREDEPKIVKESNVSGENNKEDESDLKYEISSEKEIGEASIQLIHSLYNEFADMDFSQATPREMVFVKNTKPGDKRKGYYVVVLRNSQDEIIARAVLNILEENGDEKILEAGNVEPFPPAFSDMQTQEEYRKAEKYPLTDPYPRISEDKAFELAKQKLGENFSFQGLTNIFISLPSLDEPYEIGVPFTPYYKFIVEGDEGKTIWIQSESGLVVDYPYLDSQMENFETMMAEERLQPPLPAENNEENKD